MTQVQIWPRPRGLRVVVGDLNFQLLAISQMPIGRAWIASPWRRFERVADAPSRWLRQCAAAQPIAVGGRDGGPL